MCCSDSIISNNYYFNLCFSKLLRGELLRQNFCIIDIETTDYSLVKKYVLHGKKIFAFISNDLDYYALKSLKNIIFIDKHSGLDDVLICLVVDNLRCNYKVKHKLSKRENDVMMCIFDGLTMHESVERLKITTKAFYAIRHRLIIKLQLGNRNSFYQSIAKYQYDPYYDEGFL